MSEEKKGEPIKGVGVLRGPLSSDVTTADGRTLAAHEWVQQLCLNIRQGGVVVLPNTKDADGNYHWDFRIEGGDSDQVAIERHDK